MDWRFLSRDGVKFGCWIHELFCARRIPRDDVFMNASVYQHLIDIKPRNNTKQIQHNYTK